MKKVKVIEQCALCGDSFKYGAKQYDGQYLPHYEMFLCEECYRGSWDGFAPHLENKLIPHLENKGISMLERNDKGCYPR